MATIEMNDEPTARTLADIDVKSSRQCEWLIDHDWRTEEWVDAHDVHHDICPRCGKTWMYGRMNERRATIFRVLLALGKDWDEAMAAADKAFDPVRNPKKTAQRPPKKRLDDIPF